MTIAYLPDTDEYDLDRKYANVTGFGRYQDNSKLSFAINLNLSNSVLNYKRYNVITIFTICQCSNYSQ